MTFRTNEAEERGYQRTVGYLIGRSVDPAAREHSTQVLQDLFDRYGPVIDSYPHWHPLVAANNDNLSPVTTPSDRCGYRGLDHTVYLKNAFITCPYANVEEVLASVEQVAQNSIHDGIATISAERIDAQLYHPNAHPILIKCTWDSDVIMNSDGTIPSSIAIPLLLEREVPQWRTAELAETWKTMAPYFLGQPCGSRSSLFINQETGQAMKTIWNLLNECGMYGPIKTGIR
jgi:hypothetical protein